MWLVKTRAVNGIEDLRHIRHGAEVEMVQLDAGPLRGAITHIASEDFGLSIGSFSGGVRGRGIFSQETLTLGIALIARGPIYQWSHDCSFNDLTICPPGSDHESVYRNRTTVAGLSIRPSDLAAHFAREGRFGDEDYWHKVKRITVNPESAIRTQMYLSRIANNLMDKNKTLGRPAADYVRRSIAEAFGLGFLHAYDGERMPLIPAAKIVRDTEAFLTRVGNRPIHISEICSDLKLTRRTLQRAFTETLGIGPIDFIRKSRLASVYSTLRRSDPASTTVGDVAAEYGFTELGRFAGYYRRIFGEHPSETLRGASRGPVVQGGMSVHL